MINSDWLGALMIGFLGSAHCMGMCGGIASAVGMSSVSHTGKYLTPLFYNIGRILSYSFMGSLVGGTVATAAQIVTESSALTWLRLFSAVVMVILALYIGRWWQGLVVVEKAGQHIWKYIAPLTSKLLPLKSPYHAVPLGFLWGWLPCGLVYSTLTWAAVSGSAANGALIMLSFGVGTFPSMILIGIGATYATRLKNSVLFRQTGALILLAYGIYIVASTAPLL